MADVQSDQAFVEYVVKNLVDNPNDVELERSVDDRGVLLQLSVHPDDMGKVIGKAGSTAKAIRTLLRVVGAKSDERLNLKIVDKEGNEPGGNRDEGSTSDNQASKSKAASTEPRQAAEAPSVDVESETEAIKAKAREGLEDLDMDI